MPHNIVFNKIKLGVNYQEKMLSSENAPDLYNSLKLAAWVCFAV